MKIIKEGAVPTFKGTCHFCGCEVECVKSEGSISYRDIPTLSVYCPTVGCGNQIITYPVVLNSKQKVIKAIKSMPRK